MWHENLNVAVRIDATDCLNHIEQHLLNARPTGGTQNDDCNFAVRKILQVFEVLIGRHQDIEALTLCLLQQLAVAESAPTQFVDGGNLMRAEMVAQRDRRTLKKITRTIQLLACGPHAPARHEPAER